MNIYKSVIETVTTESFTDLIQTSAKNVKCSYSFTFFVEVGLYISLFINTKVTSSTTLMIMSVCAYLSVAIIPTKNVFKWTGICFKKRN